MDQYVPLVQRQQAQSLARQMEAEERKRRAVQLAAADLGRGEPAAPPAPVAAPSATAPARTAALTAVPRAENVRRPQATQMSTAASAPSAPVRAADASAPISAATPAPAPQAKTGAWAVQLGAFGVAANADRLWNKLAGNPALAGTQKRLVLGGRVTRLRAVGFYTRAEASRACAALSRTGQACLVAKPPV